MSTLLRKDGRVTFYQYERFISKRYGWGLIDGWKGVSWYEGPKMMTEPTWRPCTANGECWQKYGHHGFMSEEEANAALPVLLKAMPRETIRLVRVELAQETTVIVTVSR